MRKQITKFFCALFALVFLMPALQVQAAAPYAPRGVAQYRSLGYWRLDDEGKSYGNFYMQSPYIPATDYPILGNPLYDADRNSMPGFHTPADLYIDSEDYIYVVDSRQNRAVKMTGTGEFITQYGAGEDSDEEGPHILEDPNGIYVGADFKVYICDTGNNRIAIFENDGTFIREILKPDDQRLSTDMFMPEKMSIDTRGLFVVACRGVNEGLLQITPEGEFKGFFGANLTQPSVLDKLKVFFYSYEQRQSSQKIAATINDVFIDSEGYIYTATPNINPMQLKKYNVGAENLFKDRNFDVYPLTAADREYERDMVTNFTSVCVDANGNIFALDSGTQRIFMYDRFGEPVLSFGQRMYDTSQIVVGLLSGPTSIRVDSRGRLYVTDQVYGGVIVYTPTEYAQKLVEINYLFNEGLYSEAESVAQQVLLDNVYIDKANIVLGKNYFRERDWTEAMDSFRKAKNTTEYSEAFWEWRLTLVQKYFAYAVLAIALIAFAFVVKNIVKNILKRKQNKPDETGGVPL